MKKSDCPRKPTKTQRCSAGHFPFVPVGSLAPRPSLLRARIPAVHLTGDLSAGQGDFARESIRTLVDEVWREMTRYAPERVAVEAQAFLAQQPHVAAFSHAVTQGANEAVQRAALGLCFLLFKVLERSLGRPLRKAGGGADRRRLRRHPRLARRAGGGRSRHGGTGDGRRRAPEPGHPHSRHAVWRRRGGGGLRRRRVRANLALLLGTLTDALDLGPVDWLTRPYCGRAGRSMSLRNWIFSATETR